MALSRASVLGGVGLQSAPDKLLQRISPLLLWDGFMSGVKKGI